LTVANYAAGVSDEREAVFEEAIAATWTADHGRALDLLSQAEALGHPDAPFEKACFLRALGRYADAEVAFRGAIDGGDQDADVTLANMLVDDLDRPREAIAIYRAAIDRGVDVARRNLASTLIDLGRSGEAIELLSDTPTMTAEALITLGYALEKEGRLADALAVYERAADDFPPADSSRAAVLQELGDFDGAVTAYRSAIERGDPDAPTYLGYLYSSRRSRGRRSRLSRGARRRQPRGASELRKPPRRDSGTRGRSDRSLSPRDCRRRARRSPEPRNSPRRPRTLR
jgi:tetratricopeptide (TPR) repeat protein